MTDNQKKLVNLLKEMFQFNQADLDFGIYRIMKLRRDEISRFIEHDLPEQITEGLQELAGASNTEKITKIDKKIDEVKSLGLDKNVEEAQLTKFEAKKKAIQNSTDISAVEADVYNHLTNFFGRYYDDGDFISQRRYKDGVYAIPYEGEEVKLYWANSDQYYVKTSEYFKDYTFKTGYGETIHFKLVEAETDKDNNKSNDKRFFQLHEEKPFKVNGEELFIYMEYKTGDKKKQDDYIADVVKAFTADSSKYPDFAFIVKPGKDGKTELERQLNRYTKRNTFDYFIHKDLKKFLNRELDFYIKNDVIFLDDIEEQDEAKTKEYLTKAKVIRKIARKIIDFLAQIEEFEKKLYLKKKFVVETNYCITLDRVPEEFYPEIAANEAQRKEWVRLFAIDEIEGNLTTVAYSEPLTVEFLKANPFLVLDTAFFSDAFKEKLIDGIDNLDEKLDGLMIHSESYQALELLNCTYYNRVKCIYIDPPYNTGSDDFVYKDNYMNSSWDSMFYDRVKLAYNLLTDDGSISVSIDDNELSDVISLLNLIFGKQNQIAIVAVKMSRSTGVKMAHEDDKPVRYKEYLVIYAKNKDYFNINPQYIETDEFDERYTKFVPNIEDEPSKWKFENIRKYIASFKDDKAKLLEFYTNNANRICRFAANNQEAFLMTKGQKYCQQIITSTGLYKYAFDGQKVLFYDSKFKIINGKKVFAENAGDFWSDIVNHVNDLSNEGGVTLPKGKKPEFLLERIINLCSNKGDLVLDFCLGSGTSTAVATKLDRKFIGVEVMPYFWNLPLKRMKRVLGGEQRGISHEVGWKGSGFLKYIILESYEDALNNIVLKDENVQMLGDAKEDYFLHYMLNTESDGSVSLLNADKLDKPFDYKMNITRNLESKERTVDLVETFNYLIGLKVEHSYALASFDADFTTGKYGAVTAKLRSGKSYKIKTVEGTLPSGERTLVIWREMTGDVVKDNAVLDAFFLQKKTSTKDFEYRKIFVNCDNNLQNMRTDEEHWKVILIEKEMKKRMFESVK